MSKFGRTYGRQAAGNPRHSTGRCCTTGCDWCKENRLHKLKRQAPAECDGNEPELTHWESLRLEDQEAEAKNKQRSYLQAAVAETKAALRLNRDKVNRLEHEYDMLVDHSWELEIALADI
jgi:hypothetical protein